MTSKPHVRFYTKPGCHLCEDALREIERAGCRELYTIELIDIRTDPDLQRRYGHDIPVLTIDGVHAFRHRLTAEEFRRAVKR